MLDGVGVGVGVRDGVMVGVGVDTQALPQGGEFGCGVTCPDVKGAI